VDACCGISFDAGSVTADLASARVAASDKFVLTLQLKSAAQLAVGRSVVLKNFKTLNQVKRRDLQLSVIHSRCQHDCTRHLLRA
jgi:hypothetical protein